MTRRPHHLSQCEKILRVLEQGPVTAAGIHRIAGSSRLNSRISELRKRGYVITCEHVPGESGPEAYLYELQSCSEEPSVPPLATDGGFRKEADAADTPSSASSEQLSLVDVWRDGLKPDATVIYLHDQDNYSRKVGAA